MTSRYLLYPEDDMYIIFDNETQKELCRGKNKNAMNHMVGLLNLNPHTGIVRD